MPKKFITHANDFNAQIKIVLFVINLYFFYNLTKYLKTFVAQYIFPSGHIDGKRAFSKPKTAAHNPMPATKTIYTRLL